VRVIPVQGPLTGRHQLESEASKNDARFRGWSHIFAEERGSVPRERGSEKGRYVATRQDLRPRAR
jgi:hypothetical protein